MIKINNYIDNLRTGFVCDEQLGLIKKNKLKENWLFQKLFCIFTQEKNLIIVNPSNAYEVTLIIVDIKI